MKEEEYILKQLQDWPINKFYSERPRIVELLARASKEILAKSTNGNLASILNQTVYSEKLRAKTNPLKVDPPNEYSYWSGIEAELSKSSVADNRDKVLESSLSKITTRYAEEIAGNFRPSTFLFASKVLGWIFRVIYNPFKAKGQGYFWGKAKDLHKKIRVTGPMDHIRDLFDKGTVVVVPTHFSNLDSILIGYAIQNLTGLPAFSYGAGLNLYDMEVLAYYMSRLGAYKIDRRKKNPIYSQTLKQFSSISVLEGMNNIFFPGGGRARNGMLEKDLKLGILSTLIDAQNEFYLRNQDRKIIVVPLVLSYHFVFDANNLVQQHLRSIGKANYMQQRLPKKASMQKIRFLRRLFKRGSNVTLSFGQPIDIFGNELDKEARSVKNGEVVNIKEYFQSDGQATKNTQRNRVYTRHLGDALVKSYEKENVVLTSHIVCFTAFTMFRKQYPNMEIYNLVNVPTDFFSFTTEEVLTEMRKVITKLKEMNTERQIKLSPEVTNDSIESVLEDGIDNVSAYHFQAPIILKGDKVRSENLRLLYFYHNRLWGYKLHKVIETKSVRTFKLAKSVY